MKELKPSIKGSRQMHWTDVVYTCLDEQKKPLSVSDLRHCIIKKMPEGFDWTIAYGKTFGVVLSHMVRDKKITHIKYKGYGGFYGRNEWVVEDPISFKGFDPHTKTIYA